VVYTDDLARVAAALSFARPGSTTCLDWRVPSNGFPSRDFGTLAQNSLTLKLRAADWLQRGLEAEVTVFLLPARTDTRWFHNLILPHAREIRFCRGRLKFGGAMNSALFPSMIVVFGE
jgi:hypothetical protein